MSMHIDRSFAKVSRAVSVGVLGFALSQGSISYLPDSSPVVSFVKPAVAEFRAAQKRTYFRFAPKFVEGMKFYGTDLKAGLDKDNYDAVTKLFDVYVTKVNPDLGDKTDTYFNNHFTRPMTVLSGSFAERGVSPKQRLLLEKEKAFEAAMSELEGCIKDRRGEGFFAPDIKMPKGAERTKQAQKAYDAGKLALNEYVEAMNDGLMLELNKLNKI
jgi:hypothetical protein